MLRRMLALVTNAAGVVAALLLIAMVVSVVAQVLTRMFGVRMFDAGELAGFLLATMSFLGLAYTFRAGGHIRVSALLSVLAGPRRRALELACLVAAVLITAMLSWSSISLVRDSLEYESVSTGLLAVPLWIPQCGMVVGAILLMLVFIEALVDTVRGKVPVYQTSGHAPSTAE